VLVSREFVSKVLSLEAPGGSPASVTAVVPSITRPGAAFEMRVAVLDEKGYPSLECDGILRVKKTTGADCPGEVRFRKGLPAVDVIPGMSLAGEGMHRFEVELDGRTFFSNPTYCANRPLPGIFWGDPHVHTVLSACILPKCRSLIFCYVAARYLTGLDWVVAADHVSNGRCDPSKWREQRAACHLFNDPPHFVTLLGYEASLKGGAGGDNNVYFADDAEMFVDEYEEGNVKTLCDKLAGHDFFVVPHHTTRTGKHGEIPDEIYPGPELMPLVEVYSKWGASEYRGNPVPLDKVHDGPAYAVDLLRRGLMLGFIAGTDSHATMPSGLGEESDHVSKPPGFTAVRAAELSRGKLFGSLRARRCYATAGERIYLDVNLNGLESGGCFRWADVREPRKLSVSTAGVSDVRRVDIVRNGETIHSQTVNSWKTTLDYLDEDDLDSAALDSPHFDRPFVFYYVRVTCESGARAWSSPIWLKLGA